MNNLFLFFFTGLVNLSYSQDSLYVGKTWMLPEVRRSICTRSGVVLAELEFQKEYGKIFDIIAQLIKSNINVHFEIRNYTDSRGHDTANLSLSQYRANDWIKSLLNKGANPKQLVDLGFGESMPRTVCLKDSIYYVSKPDEDEDIPILLSEEYIMSFHKKDKGIFDLLHLLNRRSELVVVLIDEIEKE